MFFQPTRIKALKIYFLMSGAVKSATTIKSLKNYFLCLEWLKTYFDAFPGLQNQVLKKDIFQRLELLKTCFDAFAHNSRPPESSS